jgi:predicted RNase H-like HicB family nuclease
MNTAYEFVGVVHQNAHNEFVLRFPDLPGCSASASTEEELRSRAAHALTEYLAPILLSGNSVPQPSMFTTILSDPRWRAGRAMRISAAECGLWQEDQGGRVG